MNRKRISYIVILTIFLLAMTLIPTNAIQNVMYSMKIKPLSGKTIAIDPGHGGIDGGTNKGDILEKDINLAIGLKLRDILTNKGAEVIMTREEDVSLDSLINSNASRHRRDLGARVKIVNESKADLFISLHVNHIKNVKRMGPIVFYYTDSEEEKHLAEHMQKYLNDISTYKQMDIAVQHGATPGNYYVLAYTEVPGIIVEMGFISNEIDRRLLLDEEHQNEIVQQISKGIIDYLHERR